MPFADGRCWRQQPKVGGAGITASLAAVTNPAADVIPGAPAAHMNMRAIPDKVWRPAGERRAASRPCGGVTKNEQFQDLGVKHRVEFGPDAPCPIK
jgi:hypothetical protein